ncbi:hypothetical protein M9458_011162, partial [Cirrhinus mrigala]
AMQSRCTSACLSQFSTVSCVAILPGVLLDTLSTSFRFSSVQNVRAASGHFLRHHF